MIPDSRLLEALWELKRGARIRLLNFLICTLEQRIKDAV